MNGLQQKEEREDMLAVRHLKAELGKNLTPQRDKVQRGKGRGKKTGRGHDKNNIWMEFCEGRSFLAE